MQVIAIEIGFYKARRRPGEVFEVPEGMKGSWFKPVSEGSEVKQEPKPKGRPKSVKPVDSDQS